MQICLLDVIRTFYILLLNGACSDLPWEGEGWLASHQLDAVHVIELDLNVNASVCHSCISSNSTEMPVSVFSRAARDWVCLCNLMLEINLVDCNLPLRLPPTMFFSSSCVPNYSLCAISPWTGVHGSGARCKEGAFLHPDQEIMEVKLVLQVETQKIK